MAGPATVDEALAEGARLLVAAGCDTPRLDAELLMAHCLGRDRTWLVAHGRDPLTLPVLTQWKALLARRSMREPLPYLLGFRGFLDMNLAVAGGVLIPRPETELLVETSANLLPPGALVLEVGTGSGCVALGLARLRPDAHVMALECSPAAAAVAEENFAAVQGGSRVRLVRGHFPENVPAGVRFDAVVSNPPYVPTAEIEKLQPEVRAYEPRVALDGGADGMASLRALVRHAPGQLRSGGLLALEVGHTQAAAIRRMLTATGTWCEVATHRDLAGIDRVVTATFRGSVRGGEEVHSPARTAVTTSGGTVPAGVHLRST